LNDPSRFIQFFSQKSSLVSFGKLFYRGDIILQVGVPRVLDTRPTPVGYC
jgi:hypothetical protein